MVLNLTFFLDFNKIESLEPYTSTFLLFLFYLFRLGKPVKLLLKPVTYLDTINTQKQFALISWFCSNLSNDTVCCEISPMFL